MVPWALAFAPDGRLFFTERPGRVRLIENGRLVPDPIAILPVATPGADEMLSTEAGLLGLAVDPSFPDSPFLYVMYTYAAGSSFNQRISRLRLDGLHAAEDKVLLDGIPGGQLHPGGAIHFGPDGKLYVSTGDADKSDNSQQLTSLGGKFLRINRDGTIPSDNPSPGSPIYSTGLRDPQGFDWQPGTGALYATDHGDNGNDEVNRIEPGANYGWPDIEGTQQQEGMKTPLFIFVVAPSGAAFYRSNRIKGWNGSFFIACLKGERLARVVWNKDGTGVAGYESLFIAKYGRIRAVAEGPDGALYFSTSNRDGRSRLKLGPQPQPEDDRILRVVPA